MADVKITALPARTAVASTDILPVVDAAAGTPATQKATVAQVRAALMPVVLTADVSGVLPAGNQAPQTLAGDVTGTTAASVISNLAVSKLAPSGTNTQVLTTVGGVATWAAASSGYVAPTGTGYPHITGGAQDAAAVALTWTGDATGTGTGSSFALTVVKVNGASVPAAGALTTGNAAYVSGASALTYSALNLAGGAGWVTGVLPTGNQASQTMAGDVTGTTAASVVAKVNGATVPAAGALTTGAVLQVNGSSALGYSLIANANVSGAAAIASTKVVQATGTGFPHVTSGVLDAASIKVDLTNSAHVTVPATANGVVTTDGSVLQQASNVLAGSGFISIGATPAAAGTIRLPYAATDTILGAKDSVGTDRAFIRRTAADQWTIGAGGTTYVTWYDDFQIQTWGRSLWQVYSGSGGNNTISGDGTTIKVGLPAIGDSAASSPYSVHGKTTVATAGTHTMTAAEYAYDAIMFSASTGGTYTFPLPATDAGAYYKTIIYTGNSSAVITNGGGAPKNVTVATNTTMRCLFDTAGVHPLSGSAGAYP